jgi:cytochrome c-type biogenesis protein CcmF
MDGVLTPEGILLTATWAFVLLTAFVWFATMAPLFAELARGEKVAVTPEFFNRWMAPLGLALLFLIALGTIVRWRTPGLAQLARRAALPASGGALASIAVLIAVGRVTGVAQPLVSTFLVGFLGVASTREILSVVSRLQAGKGSPSALRRRLGGQLVHLAVALLFAGFTGAAFTAERAANLGVGESLRIGDYSLTLIGLREDNNYERNALMADLEVRRDGNPIGIFSPARHLYHSHPNQPTSEVVIRVGPTEDLFLVFGEGDPLRGRAVVRAVINPMVLWIWIGGGLLVLGALIALVPVGRLAALLGRAKRDRRRLAEIGVGLGIVIATSIGIGLGRGLASAMVAFTGFALIGTIAFAGQALGILADGGKVRR